jgi:hypothetical protein
MVVLYKVRSCLVGANQEITIRQVSLYFPAHAKVYQEGTLTLPSTVKWFNTVNYIDGTIGGCFKILLMYTSNVLIYIHSQIKQNITLLSAALSPRLSRFIVPPSSVSTSVAVIVSFLASQNFFHDDCCKNQRMSNASSENIYLQQFCIWNLNLFPRFYVFFYLRNVIEDIIY